MKTSDYGLQFIAGWEGLRNQLYDDGGTGKGNCTIGVGHLVHYDPCDGRADEQPFLNGITDQQAYDLLAQDVQNAESSVSKTITIALNQNQFDALVDFTFNCGAGSLEAIATVVNTGGDVCAAIAPYNKGTGSSGKLEVLDALARRRAAECELYNKEEEVKPFLVWDLDRGAWWFIGSWGASWITRADDVAAIESIYGKGTLALHATALKAMGAA